MLSKDEMPAYQRGYRAGRKSKRDADAVKAEDARWHAHFNAALQGMLASPTFCHFDSRSSWESRRSSYARWAADIADACVKEAKRRSR